MTRGHKIAAAIAVAVIALTGCSAESFTGGGTFKDVEGIDPIDADKYTLLNNADGFPNIVIVCYKGISFSTTTREAAGAILRVPELDKTCPGYTAPTS